MKRLKLQCYFVHVVSVTITGNSFMILLSMKIIIILFLNLVCFIVLRYVNIFIIFLVGGYASNLYKDFYWHLLPPYLLQVLGLIYFANKTKNNFYYITIIVISILFVSSYFRLIPEIILPY